MTKVSTLLYLLDDNNLANDSLNFIFPGVDPLEEKLTAYLEQLYVDPGKSLVSKTMERIREYF